MTLFVVSNIQHLVLAQMVAHSLPGDKALVIWHMPGCASVVAAMQHIQLDGYWKTIVVLPERAVAAYAPHDFPFAKAKGRLRAVRATVMEAQRAIDDAVKEVGEFSRLYICNTTAKVDRRLWSFAKRRKVPVCAIEDGLKSYLTAGVYERVERTSLRKALSATWHYCVQAGLDRFALRYALPFSCDEPLDEIHLCFPEAASAACRQAGKIVALNAQISNGAFAEMLAKIDGINEGMEIPADSWLYLSRADSEDGLLTKEQEIAIVSGLLLDVRKARSGSLYIKAHPRDKKGKIEAILARTPGLRLFELSSPLPIELLAARFPFSVYLGTWSGPLVYLPLLHGAKTYALLPVFIERARDLGCAPDRLVDILVSVRSSFERETVWVDGARWLQLLEQQTGKKESLFQA